MTDFWPMFTKDVSLGVSDGPRAFSDVNCLFVRDEVPPPSRPTIHNASAAILLIGDSSPLVNPADRGKVIQRLGADIPLPSFGSFESVTVVTHTESETALAAVLAQNAWCQWLGMMIDAADRNDHVAAAKALDNLKWFVDAEQLTKVDSAISREVRIEVIDGASRGDPVWPVAEYRSNCFGLDLARDSQLNRRNTEAGSG